MREIHFDSLRVKVAEQIRVISATDPVSHSTEWFLLKYLKRILKKTEPPSIPGQVEGTVRSLVRFYVDNIDEKSELGERCVDIYEEYRKVLREHQAKDA
jgi:hypothetical protein